MVWDITNDGETPGVAKRSLHGHNHFVSDVTLSNDGAYALSSSWDHTLRLWDVNTGDSQKTFSGHTKDCLSVAFSPDNRQIVSGSRDKSIKLWNTIGECKYTLNDAHSDWVSCVRFSPNAENPVVVSAGWDKVVKVTSLASNFQQTTMLVGHTGQLNTVTVSPDGSLCASGGKDGVAMLWDLNEGKVRVAASFESGRGRRRGLWCSALSASWRGVPAPCFSCARSPTPLSCLTSPFVSPLSAQRLYTLEAGSCINALCFSPNRYWLCAATAKNITIWDLESKAVVAELSPQWDEQRSRKALTHFPTCLAWSADGSTLFSGYTDNVVRVWAVSALA